MKEGIDNSITNQNKEISLKELLLEIQRWWQYLLSKWILILVFGLLGAIVGFFYALNKEPTYTATTTFVLEDEKSGGSLGGLAGLASMAGVDISSGGGGIFQGENLLELYKSRRMIEKTLLTEVKFEGRNQLLVDRYVDINHLRDNWKNRPDLLKVNFRALTGKNRLADSLFYQFVGDINQNYLSVTKPDKKLNIIKIEVKSKDEFFAKNFNDEIVRNVNDFYVQTKTKKSQDNVAILQHQTDSVRAVMNGAIFSAAIVADATPNLNPTRLVQRSAPIQRSQFNAETNKAVLSELVKNLEMTKMTLLKEVPLIQVIDKPVYPLKKEKFGVIKSSAIGGFIIAFLAILVLVIRKTLKQLLD